MKYLKKITITIFCLSLMVICGCSDEDNSLKVYIESIDLDNHNKTLQKINVLETYLPFGINSLRIGGGSGEYTASSSNDSIVKVDITEKYLHLTYYKTGTVQITISDADNQKLILPVTISEGKREIKILESSADVLLESDEDMQKYEAEINTIKDEIINQLLPVNSRFELSYQSVSDNHQKLDGAYILYPNPTSTNEFVIGTFTDEQIYNPDNNSGYRSFRFLSEGTESMYMIGQFKLISNELKTSVVENRFNWVKNYTNVYKTRYPHLKITRAIGIQLIKF